MILSLNHFAIYDCNEDVFFTYFVSRKLSYTIRQPLLKITCRSKQQNFPKVAIRETSRRCLFVSVQKYESNN